MPLHSIYFLPHGGVIVPELEGKLNDEAKKLNKGMKEVADEIKSDNIQLIIMTSPHGYTINDDFMVYFHNIFESWEILIDPENKEQKRVERRMWQGNTQVASLLYQSLIDAKIKTQPIILGDQNFPFKLGWGETIPLGFIAHERLNLVIFSTPMVRNDATFDTLKNVGKTISQMLNSDNFKSIKVSLVISGDLSHKHDPKHHYGFHENAKIFDKLSEEWFSNSTNDLLDKLISLEDTAAPCGLQGMAILQGLFDIEDNWNNTRNIYACPTYFGMDVASWIKAEYLE